MTSETINTPELYFSPKGLLIGGKWEERSTTIPQSLGCHIVDLVCVCSFNFDWQQRGSGGNVCNSLSGHGFLVGARSKKSEQNV